MQRTVFAFDPANPKKTVSSKVDLNRPHVIVSHLMKQFKDYELNAKKELEKFIHPTYMNMSVGGAWPIADFIKPSAECQAIVRFVRNVINQLGVPGTAETLYVFAKPESPNDAQESDQRNGYKKHALVDRPITDSDVGKVFPPSHTRTDSGISMGFNQYEACMRFSYERSQGEEPADARTTVAAPACTRTTTRCCGRSRRWWRSKAPVAERQGSEEGHGRQDRQDPGALPVGDWPSHATRGDRVALDRDGGADTAGELPLGE